MTKIKIYGNYKSQGRTFKINDELLQFLDPLTDGFKIGNNFIS